MHDSCVVLPKDNFRIIKGTICYRFVPLWSTLSTTLKDYQFGYYDPSKTKYPEDNPDYYMLVCIDDCGDTFYFGRWQTKEELLDWLNNPYVYGLYDKNNKLVAISRTEYEAMLAMFLDGGQTIKEGDRLYAGTLSDEEFLHHYQQFLFG